jgi:RNA polymerase sigma-70 factor (ECF subfamily)
MLCENYWFPLYAFVRRTGYSVEDAQDLTQEFFARLLVQRFFTKADRRKGKFRSFLLAALKHFLADQWDRAHARKRGGTETVISFDSLDAETRYRLEPAQGLTPEKMFEKQWALSLLEHVLSRLHAEMAAEGKSALFEALKDTLTGVRSITYAAIGAKLGMTEGAVKVAVHRMRRRYRDLLRAEIAETVANPDEIGDEIRYLLSCL